jgi:hypothetical protein
MKRLLKICAISAAALSFAAAAFAEDPVAFVMSVSGSYSCTDADGSTRDLAPKSPLFSGTSIKRKSASGYIKYLDANGRVSPGIVDPEITIKETAKIASQKQSMYLAYIGGTMARSGKGAAAEGFLEWLPEIGSIMEKDVRDGGMSLVFGHGPDSSETGRYFPLTLKLAPRYQIKSGSYRVVQNTLVVAEGRLRQEGDSWVLPLAEIDLAADETIPLEISFTVEDSEAQGERSIAVGIPYTVMADDGFIEGEIEKAERGLAAGASDPDESSLARIAKLGVYADYRMNLYALSVPDER